MGYVVERELTLPQEWLALADTPTQLADQIPFIEGVTYEARDALSDFNKRYPVEIKLPGRIIKVVEKMGRAIALASLLYLTFISRNILEDDKQEEPPPIGIITWREIDTLPVELSGGWIIDEAWIVDNCEMSGSWKGSGIPPLRIISPKIDPDLWPNLPSPLTFERDFYLASVNNRKLFADALCRKFGTSNQTTPEFDP